MTDVKLTIKQKRFIEAYLGKANFNITKAAKLAGYSEKTSYSIGSELLKKPEIKEAVSTRLQESAMGADEVLMRLGVHGRSESDKTSLAALNTLAKHHGLLDDQLNIKIENEVEKFLDTLESELDQETYERILSILESSKA
jgi:hypothetical protein